MDSAGTNSGTKARLNITDVGPRFGATKLAAAAIRAALTLAMLLTLLTAPRPAQAQTETTLYNFTGGSDGAYPASSLISDGAGNFYGTTALGGVACPSNQRGCGTVFEISPNGSGGWNQTVLHTFSGQPDGANPYLAPVMFDSVGNLYGTTEFGGWHGVGAVFELSPAGTSWTETILWGLGDGGAGEYPKAGLIMDPAGNLYGTTSQGPGDPGYVFEISPSNGGWGYEVLYTAPASGGLTMDAAGNLYGTTSSTVFVDSPKGTGWYATVIHTFTGSPNDGFNAQGTLVFDQAGNLYGTTYSGGAQGGGTVYKLSPGPNGQWTEEILYSFKRGKDGHQPWAGVTLDAAGNIYGTTALGGNKNKGTVFELVAPVGTGNYQEKVLWSFNGTDGVNPYGIPVLDSAGNLYGTAALGGTSNAGVVFEVTPPAATATTLTSSPNPSTYGQAVTFTAVVSSTAGAPPDGELITFKHVATVLGTGALSGGSASFTTSTLKLGTTAVTAAYGGDPKFAGSTSNPVKQVVSKAATTTTLSSSPNPSTYGQAVTFTAAVASSQGAPPDGESVTFKKGTTVLGTGSLSGGSASFTTSALPVGTNSVMAVYGGDSNFARSKSNVVKQVVD